jgi:preprotein translocase subunit YajC
MIRLFFTLMLAPVSAFAQAATDAVATASPLGGSPFASALPMLLIFAVMYFLLIRPQQKRMKAHQAALVALKKGDKVVTGGGIIGKITKLSEGETITVEIASGVEVVVVKSTVSGLVGEPNAASAAPEKKKLTGKGSNKNDNAVPSRDSIANDN